MQIIDIFFSIAILVMSVVVHEVSHGYSAALLGDPTARISGRLTLNPLKHLDPVGSILVPILTSFSGFAFGWAKPVPYNPYNLRNQRFGELIVAAAGPAANIVIALVLGLLLRFLAADHLLSTPFEYILGLTVQVNILLAIFNLIPIPPLDGSKVLYAFIPLRFQGFRQFMEQYSIFILLFFILFLWQFITPVITYVFRFLTGIVG